MTGERKFAADDGEEDSDDECGVMGDAGVYGETGMYRLDEDDECEGGIGM